MADDAQVTEHSEDVKAQSAFAGEVQKIHEGLDTIAKECVAEGKAGHHTAQAAYDHWLAKVKKFLGAWT